MEQDAHLYIYTDNQNNKGLVNLKMSELNYDEILLYKNFCMENPFLHQIQIQDCPVITDEERTSHTLGLANSDRNLGFGNRNDTKRKSNGPKWNLTRSTQSVEGYGKPVYGGTASPVSNNSKVWQRHYVDPSSRDMLGSDATLFTRVERSNGRKKATQNSTNMTEFSDGQRPRLNSSKIDSETIIINHVNSILNKLSISNFDKLSSELMNIEIVSDCLLERIVKSIFEKAIMEPHFGEIYSKLCLCFGNFNIKFKRLLLITCQTEFEKRNSSDNKMASNIVFIGQLFKTQMISEQIINSCIDKLLEQSSHINIECVCKLLEITGNKMRTNLDPYFSKLKSISESEGSGATIGCEPKGSGATISKNTSIDSRHRFMIKDIIELRENNWIPRKTNQPLKMI